MRKYIIARLCQMVPVLFGITLLTFGLMQLAADDAVDVFYARSGAVSEEVKAARRAELGLDRPLYEQYFGWLGGVLRGDMGKSYISGKDVTGLFAEKLPATVSLMLASLALTMAFAVPCGIAAAVKQGGMADWLIRFLSFVGNSLPNFFVALLLLYFIALKLRLLPVMPSEGDWRGVLLPALTLAVSMGAKYVRQVRTAVLEELSKPYVEGARARGVSETQILFGSVLRSAMVPLLTLLALSMGSLLGGTAIVETIFLWDGVGRLAIDAVLTRDYPLIQVYIIWMSFIYVGINLLADIGYYYLDPRTREKGRGAA